MERQFIIYKHTSPSGNVYIGQTCQKTWQRWGGNGRGYSEHVYFWNAIKKHGWKNFTHEVLYENLTQSEANEIEASLIKHYTELGISYNIKPGGNNHSGWHLTEEAKHKISIANRGRKRTPEQKLRMSILAKSRPLSEEFKKHWDEVRGKPSHNRGKTLDKETRRKISATLKSEHNTWRGKKHSEKTIKKMSEIKRGKLNPMYGRPGSATGTKWMNNGSIMKRVPGEEQDMLLKRGWVFGVIRSNEYMDALKKRMQTSNPNKYVRQKTYISI